MPAVFSPLKPLQKPTESQKTEEKPIYYNRWGKPEKSFYDKDFKYNIEIHNEKVKAEKLKKDIDTQREIDKQNSYLQTTNNSALQSDNSKTEDLSKIGTEAKKFKFTPTMTLWLRTAIELATDNVTEIATKSGIDRKSWYGWQKLPGFFNWYIEQYKHERRRWLPMLDAIGMERAKKNFDYWKAMNQKAGELLEETGAVNITGEKVIAILGGSSTKVSHNSKDV